MVPAGRIRMGDQVPPRELAAWGTALEGRVDVAFHEYPALNHRLMAGTGPSTPAEYSIPGHVAPEPVADLAAWILGRQRRSPARSR